MTNAYEAVPLFKQMEKIEAHKKEIEEKLLSGTEVNLDQRLVPLETFSEFSKIVKKSLSKKGGNWAGQREDLLECG